MKRWVRDACKFDVMVQVSDAAQPIVISFNILISCSDPDIFRRGGGGSRDNFVCQGMGPMSIFDNFTM